MQTLVLVSALARLSPSAGPRVPTSAVSTVRFQVSVQSAPLLPVSVTLNCYILYNADPGSTAASLVHRMGGAFPGFADDYLNFDC